MDQIFLIDTQAQGQTFVIMNGVSNRQTMGGGETKGMGKKTDNPADQEKRQPDILQRWVKETDKGDQNESHRTHKAQGETKTSLCLS